MGEFYLVFFLALLNNKLHEHIFVNEFEHILPCLCQNFYYNKNKELDVRFFLSLLYNILYIYYTIFLNKNQPEVLDTSGLKLFIC